MLQTTVMFEGNIAADIELTYTQTGKQVVQFPVLVNRRSQAPDTGQWSDGEPTDTPVSRSVPSANTSPTRSPRGIGC